MANTILVVAETAGETLAASTLSTLTAARELDGPIDVLVAGARPAAAAESLASMAGVRRVLVAEAPHLAGGLAEDLSGLVAGHVEHYSHVLAPATTFGKNLLPRVAALVDIQMVSDVTVIEDAETFVHPIYAGNANETLRVLEPHKLLTIRPTAFAKEVVGGGEAQLERIDVGETLAQSREVELQLDESDRPQLESSGIVVSGGRAFGSLEKFRLLEELAADLNAAVGASRAAVDAGYAPNDCQVGQTGKVVAPELYIAVGISGAIQHLAGMTGSKVIVAINKDPDAPIFGVADYGLVGDLFDILPELHEKIRQLRSEPAPGLAEA
ncbi:MULTISPECIES: electron transfer flavoprotein subunit alpha/FixB family protein [unclassified Thioalkalivibrio]|uniref:electron transfer flavoprotein subunit alpha/FixB family protein n=1 Tax=unclassified Thioalkalivibrio TaxID=2621013 RepID=UPI0003614948|nr:MULTISPECIES: FAD-binding protein [unclassified Thioalkalivibrio]